MKISTLVKREINSSIEYLSRFNEVTSENLIELLNENHITAPEINYSEVDEFLLEAVSYTTRVDISEHKNKVDSLELASLIVKSAVEVEYRKQLNLKIKKMK